MTNGYNTAAMMLGANGHNTTVVVLAIAAMTTMVTMIMLSRDLRPSETETRVKFSFKDTKPGAGEQLLLQRRTAISTLKVERDVYMYGGREMCMYVYIYIYIHMHMYICIHTYVHTHRSLYYM